MGGTPTHIVRDHKRKFVGNANLAMFGMQPSAIVPEEVVAHFAQITLSWLVSMT
jgi:hypothetical protein